MKLPAIESIHSLAPFGEPFRKSQETMILCAYERNVIATAHSKKWARRIVRALDLLHAVETNQVALTILDAPSRGQAVECSNGIVIVEPDGSMKGMLTPPRGEEGEK